MDKTPIEIKLMKDLSFIVNLNEVKTKEINKKNKIIKDQKELLKNYLKKIEEQQKKIIELEYRKSLHDTYYLHQF